MKTLSTLFLSLLYFFFISAQATSISQLSPIHIAPCDTLTFEIEINTPNTLTNANVVLSVPENTLYTGGDYSPTTTSNNEYIFTLPSVPANTPFTFEYSVYLPCNMILPPNGSSNEYYYQSTITLQNSSGTTLDTNIISSVVKYPILQTISNNPNIHYESHIDEQVIRNVPIFNTGTGNFKGAIKYSSSLSCDSVVLDSMILFQNEIPLQTFIGVDSFLYDSILLSNAPQTDSLHIREFYTVVGCLSACPTHAARSAILIEWGCKLNDLCNSFNAEGSIIRDDAEPLVKAYRLNPPNNPADLSNWCMHNPSLLSNFNTNLLTHFKYLLINEGELKIINYTFAIGDTYGPSEDYLFQGNAQALDPNGTLIPIIEEIPRGASICKDSITNAGYTALKKVTWQIDTLFPGDTIIVEFSLFKCCPTDEDNYFDAPIRFNTWNLHKATLFEDECKNTFQFTEGPNTTLANGDSLYTRNFEKPIILDLEQDFFTPINSMTGPTGACGAPKFFTINNTLFNTNLYFNHLSRLFFYDNNNTSYGGQIRVDITTEYGLNILDPNLNSSNITLISNNGQNWTPDSIVRVQNYVSGVNGTIVSAYYPLNVFPNYDSLAYFMGNSKFTFPLSPCCPGNPQSEYLIEFFLNTNPANCDDCWLPLSDISKQMNILCPGCITPGVIVDGNTLDLKRRNFGYLDSDDDGLADIPLVPLHADSSFIDPLSPYFAMYGDTLDLHASAYAIAGDNASGGVSLDSWNAYWNNAPHFDTLTSLYIDIQTPCASIDSFNWQVASASLRVDTLNNGNWSPSIDITPLLQNTGYPFFFEIPHNFLRNAASYFPSNFTYYHTNKYEIDISFTICGNQTDFDPFVDCPTNVVMWWGTQAMPTNSTLQIQHAGDRNEAFAGINNSNGKTLQERIQNLLPDSSLFYCESASSIMRLFRFKLHNINSWENTTNSTCYKRLSNKLKMNLGSGSVCNLFPFEYRPLQIDFEGYQFDIPNNYQINELFVRTKIPLHLSHPISTFHTVVDNSLSHTLSSLSGNVLLEIDDSEYPIATENLSVSGGISTLNNLLRGDEYLEQSVFITIEPTQVCHTDTLVANEHEPLLFLNHTGCDTSNIDTLYDTSPVNDTLKDIFIHYPYLEYIPGTQQSYQMLQDTFCDIAFSIHNLDSNWVAAPNFFIAIDHQYIDVYDVQIANSNLSFNEIHPGYYHLNTLGRGVTIDIEACIGINDCESPDTILLPIRFGYQCDTLWNLADTACFDTTIFIPLYKTLAELSNGPFIQDTTFNLCDTVAMSACTYAQYPGEVDELYAALILPPGADTASVAFTFPNTNIPPVNPVFTAFIAPNTYIFNTPPNWTLSSQTTNNLCIDFAFEYIPGCQINGGQAPSLAIGGVSYCNDSIKADTFHFDGLTLVGNNCTPLSASYTTTNALCGSGGSINLTILSGQQPFSFLWQPSNDTSQNLSNLTPGNYSLAISDGNGCDTTITNIIVEDSVIALPPITISYDTCYGTATLTAPSGSSYLWNTSETTQTITVSDTGFYQVNLIQNGCNGVSSISINQLPSPSSTPNAIPIGVTNSTTYLSNEIAAGNLPNTQASNLVLDISGELVIDLANYSFSNCKLYFAPGASLRISALYPPNYQYNINNQTQVNFENTILDASDCGIMWQGIVVDFQCLVSFSENSQVNNAMYAIELPYQGAGIRASNTSFTNNFISIYCPTGAHQLGIETYYTVFDVKHCLFNSQAPGLLNLYPNQQNHYTNLLLYGTQPAQGRISYAGIYGIEVISLAIGTNGANTFKNLANGIVMLSQHQSVFNWQFFNNSFINISKQNSLGLSNYLPTEKLQGYAVYVKNLYNAPTKTVEAAEQYMLNVDVGIYIEKSNLLAKRNTIRNCKTGIFTTLSQECEIEMYENIIEAEAMGIASLNNQNLLKHEIQDNQLTVASYFKGTGIYLSKVSTANNLLDNVKYNTINMKGGAAGITLNNVEAQEISNNNMTLQNSNTIGMSQSPNPQISSGIVQSGGQENVIANNHIELLGSWNSTYINNYNQPVGIDVINSTENIIECNHTIKTYTGIRFAGMLDGLILRGNTFENHFGGLRYTESVASNGTTNLQQYNNGNKWLGTYNPISSNATNANQFKGGAAINVAFWDLWNSGNPANQTFAVNMLNAQRYFIGSTTSPFFPPNSLIYPQGPTLSNPTLPYWFEVNNASDYNCSSSTYNRPSATPELNTTEKTADGSLSIAAFKEPLLTQEQIKLYQYLKQNDSLTSVSNKIDSFYLANEQGVMQQMYLAKQSQDSISMQGTLLQQQLNALKQQAQSLIDSLYTIDSLQASNTFTSSYIQQKKNLQQSLNTLNQNIAQLSTQIQQAREQKTNETIRKYKDILDAELIQKNQRSVIDIYLSSYAKNQTPSPLQWQELEQIAQECPLSGGNAVFTARAILQQEYTDSVRYWSDYASCIAAGFDVRSTLTQNTQQLDIIDSNLSVYPNPSKNTIFISHKLNKDKCWYVVLYNMAGQVQLQSNYCTQGSGINIKHLVAGSYVLKLFENGLLVHQEKIVKE